MNIEDYVGLAVPISFVVLYWIEKRSTARKFEVMQNWRWIGFAFFGLTLIIGGLTPRLLPLAYIRERSVFDLSAYGDAGVGGVPIGILVTTFTAYWLHRAEHRFDWLWRATHQLHHSPLRVDLLGAFYTHPLEVLIKVALGATLGAWLLGLSPVAAAIVGVVTTSLSLFQHWNIRTPRALGWIVQRPESHCLHHERSIHSRNFGDLPLWDIVFGTFQNPASFSGLVGFGEEPSARVAEMLLMRDVNRIEH